MFSALALFRVPGHVRHIEQDIARRTEVVLEDLGVAARVAIDGREVALSGGVSDAELRWDAVAAVGDLWGVRTVADRLRLRPSERPPRPQPVPRAVAPQRSRELHATAELDEEGVLTLSGEAPSEAVVEAWLARSLSLFPEGEIRDRLAVSPRGEAGAIDVAVREGLAALRLLSTGRADATASRLRISGVARDRASEKAVESALAGVLPQGVRLVVDLSIARPIRGAAGRAPVLRSLLARTREGGVVLSGIAPSEQTHRRWIDAAARLFSAERVRDRLRVRETAAPEIYEACLLAALPWVDELVNGRIEVSPTVVRIYGKAESAGEVDRMKRVLAAVGCELDLARLAVPDAARPPAADG